MARNVNVWLTNWIDVGTTIPFPRYDVDVRLEWAGDDGSPCNWEGTVRIPNDFQLVPKAWLKEMLQDLILRVMRKRLGIDE